MRFKIFSLFLFVILFLNIISAGQYGIFETPTSNGNKMPNKVFSYYWEFASDSNCATIFRTDIFNIQTDNDGRAFQNFSIPSNLTDATHLCEYRDGSLRAVLPFFSQVFDEVFARNINVSGNITAKTYFGDGSFLTGISGGNASFNQSFANTLYSPNTTFGIQILNNNSNSSSYWDNLNTFNSTQMSESNGLLNILESWLTTFINTFNFIPSTNVAWINQSNKFTQDQWLQYATPTLFFNETDGATSEKLWSYNVNLRRFTIRAYNDGQSATGTDIFTLTRNLNTLEALIFGNPSGTPILYANDSANLFGINTATPTHLLNVFGNSNLSGDVWLGNSSLYASSSGLFGIGTSSPSATLDVRGQGNFSGTIYINNVTDISTFSTAGFAKNTTAEFQSRLNNTNMYFSSLGVGTTTPTHTLNVVGNVNVTGAYLNNQGARIDSVVLLESQTTDGTNVAIITVSNYAYKDLLIKVRGIKPSVDDRIMYFKINNDLGTNYIGNTFVHNSAGSTFTSSPTTSFYVGHSQAGQGFGTGVGEVGQIDFTLLDYQDTTNYKLARWNFESYNAAPTDLGGEGNGVWKNTSKVTQLSIFMEGDIDFNSTISVYGIR